MIGRPPLIVAGWPGADWPRLHPLLDAGELPALNDVVERGVSGPLTAPEPPSLAALWTTLATGRHAGEHGVAHDAEVDPCTGEVRPATAASWGAEAAWDLFARAGRRCHVVGWPATHPGEPGAALARTGGVLVSDSYGRPTAPPDERGAAAWPLLRGTLTGGEVEIVEALTELRVSPAEIDADLLAEFVPRWREVDRALDPRPRRIAVALAETLSIHNAATFLLEAAPPDALFVHYPLLERLAGLFLPCETAGGTVGGLTRLAGTHAEFYGGVPAAAVRWLDRFLGRLGDLAGPDATRAVVSPSGYRRPRSGAVLAAGTFPPTAELPAWRRPTGLFAVAGLPAIGLRRDALAHGVGGRDLAAVFARLAGVDDGGRGGLAARRAEREIFDQEEGALPSASTAAERQGRNQSRHAAEVFVIALGPRDPPTGGEPIRLDPEEGRAWCAQFLATGEWRQVPTAAGVRRDADLARARAWLQQGEDRLALAVLTPLHAGNPEDAAVAAAVVQSCLRLGLLPAATAAAETVFDHTWGSPQAEILRGQLAYGERRYEEALACFQAAGAAADERLAGGESSLGLALLKLGRFAEAQEAFGRALARDPDDADAWLGAAHARLRLGDHAGAAEASREAVARRFDHPLAHFNLGIAQARSGEDAGAEESLRTVLGLLGVPEEGGQAVRSSGGTLAVHTRRVLAVVRRRRVEAGASAKA